MTSTLDFVDSIAASPTVRLNLGDGTTWAVVRDGTQFPPPPLRYAIASTLMQDGAVIPASAYDLRRIILDLALTGPDADATATALQALHRQLDRPGGNILRWRQGTTNPVFFRTFRTSAAAIDERESNNAGTKKRIVVELLAEPFALGLREDPVVLQTVDTNPANANGCFLDVTGVKGDVEAPAYIRFPSSALAIGQQTLFAVRRRGTPSAAPFLFQAEAMTQGTNTTTQPNDANFSGAGNNYSRCTFTTATMVTRLSTIDLGTASVDLRGKYRVFLRYRKNTGSDAINLQLRYGDVNTGITVANTVYATANTTNIVTADLGEISIPVGVDPVTDPAGVELAVSDAFFLVLRAERTSGAGTIDFDFLLLVPADDRFVPIKWADPGTDHWLLDSQTNRAHNRNSSGQVASAIAPEIPGGLPMLSPNQTNRIYMIRQVAASLSWTLTTVPNVSVSYMPRYLSVRPAST